MLEVGYLHIANPIAIISSHNHPETGVAAGLLLLDGFDLDDVSLQEMQESIESYSGSERANSKTSALGLCTTCSRDEPLLEAAKLASHNLCLLDLRLSKIRDPIRLLELIPRLKRCGVTLSLRIRPEDLSNELMEKLQESELDIIHLDLRGLNGAGPKMVKKARDCRGPVVMALADIGEFEDARMLLAMGADMVSMRGADPEFAQWLSSAVREYDCISGWGNAPKHICAGGDLRGLAFCCPPVKHCAVLGALKRAGITAEEFVNRKLALARGTPLEKGEGTCFGSLVWCCKASKMCYLREAAMQKIGLSDKEYMELKKKLAEDLLRQFS